MAIEEITRLVKESATSEVFGVWFLIGAALVFFMQAGFAMVETGFTRANNAGIDTVGNKLGSFGHRAGNDGRSSCAENQIENKGGSITAFQESTEVRQNLQIRHTDQAKDIVFCHHQTEAEENENNGSDAEIHQVFHDDVAGVLGACKSGLDHCETSLHPEHQCSSD